MALLVTSLLALGGMMLPILAVLDILRVGITYVAALAQSSLGVGPSWNTCK